MRVLVTGACGFVGSTLLRAWVEHGAASMLYGFDSLVRPGSEENRRPLARSGVRLIHGDLRSASDVGALPPVDWVIDAAANPSVLAGVDGQTSSRQLLEHNLIGTINMLEYCRQHHAGFVLLSTSRVYSVGALSGLPLATTDRTFRLKPDASGPGFSSRGVNEEFATDPPTSLYGASKLASEHLALEYGQTFTFPVWINRCGVLAGAGQFARPDQGIFAYWIHSWLARRPLSYFGFGGMGLQVRDCLHPRDLVTLLDAQMADRGSTSEPRIFNVSGEMPSACSLRECSDWCERRFGPHTVGNGGDVVRPYDVPWLVLDSGRAARRWRWRPTTGRDRVFDEIALHAERHPEWLELSAV